MTSRVSQFRIGQGVDVHAFGPGSYVVLCGERIKHPQGLVAHSDGDVALHALCDALLGAAALGDIGHHFPPEDPAWAGADSRVLTRSVTEMLGKHGWKVNNADISVICERPRLAGHIEAMRDNVAQDLKIARDKISVKATTTERLGFCGRGEGIAAMAIVSITGA